MRRALLPIAITSAIVSCNDPVSSFGGAPPMEVLGVGAVEVTSRPFVAEVAVTGTTAYTTTWSFAQSRPGYRIDVWAVRGNNPTRVDSIFLTLPSGQVVTTGDVAISDDSQLMIVAT
jgi:hypothetical protein